MNQAKEFLVKNISLWAMASVTLGLAPFNPPHIWKQMVNIYKGTFNQMIDWFDLLMHGAPWILLIIALILKFMPTKQKAS